MLIRPLRLLPLGLAAIVLLGAGCSSAAPAPAPAPSVPVQAPAASSVSSPSPVPSAKTWVYQGSLPKDQITGKQVRIATAKGDIVIALYPATAPLAVSNFLYLASNGFYDGLTFHRREEGFVIQGGDPNGNGSGGPGYQFPDELKDAYKYDRGTVAMANAGPNTNGSQFFIMLADYALPKAYTIFGHVVSGMDVVDKIQVGDKMTAVTVEAAK